MAPINVLDPNCPSRRLLDLVGSKWAVLTVYSLSNGTKRRGELQRAIGGVSQKVLGETLHELEREGIIKREVFPVIPPHVEYSLTALGETLVEPLSALIRWAERHLAEVPMGQGDGSSSK